MSLIGIAAAILKGIVTVGKFIISLAPKAAAMVTSGLVKAGVSSAKAAAVGAMVKTGIALAEIKALDKVTDATVAKIPVVGKRLDSAIDTIGTVAVLRNHLK